MATPLAPEEFRRYQRHLSLPTVGVAGQQRLKDARVLIVGAGGLGSPSALYLAAAGVGTIGLVDNDVVDESNLQRQLLHGSKDVGRAKLDSARDRLRDVNPHVEVITHAAWLTSHNALEIIADYDIVLDGTDNFATRYLINDACVLLSKPNVHGAIFQFDGQASVFATETGPCYRCLYPEPPPPGSVPDCATGGVFGVLPGLVGTIQAVETLKLILNTGDSLAGRLLLIDTMSMQFRQVRVERDPDCPACGTREITALIDYDQFCGTPALGAQAPGFATVDEVMPEQLAALLSANPTLCIVDVREPYETATGTIDGARLIPLGALPSQLATLDLTQQLVIVCQSGKRSAQAARQLTEAGARHVQSLAGGMLAWRTTAATPLAPVDRPTHRES